MTNFILLLMLSGILVVSTSININREITKGNENKIKLFTMDEVLFKYIRTSFVVYISLFMLILQFEVLFSVIFNSLEISNKVNLDGMNFLFIAAFILIYLYFNLNNVSVFIREEMKHEKGLMRILSLFLFFIISTLLNTVTLGFLIVILYLSIN